MKRALSILLCIVCILTMSSCSSIAGNTEIHIAMLTSHGTGTAEFQSFEDFVAVQEERVNTFLKEHEKGYQIALDVVSNNSIEKEDMSYDILSGRTFLTSSELEENFMDLSAELKEGGKLEVIYKSMPQSFWDSVNVNGHIYSTLRGFPNRAQCLEISPELLEKTHMQVPENLIGRPIEEWKSFFAALYEANENEPFIVNPFYLTLTSPILAGNVWECHFQLITQYLGIDYENPEKGVQCIYESEFAKKMQKMWQEYAEAGYIIDELELGDNVVKGSEADVEKRDRILSNSIQSISAFDTEVTESGLYTPSSWSYPLQSYMYSTPELSNEEQYYFLVAKNTDKFDQICEFMNDMSQDLDLVEVITLGENGQYFTIFSQNANYLPLMGVDIGLTGTVEENQIRMQERYNVTQKAPIPGFVFDITPVEEQVAAADAVLESRSVDQIMTMGRIKEWENWEFYWETLIQQLYEAGVQDIIDEANRQLEAYK